MSETLSFRTRLDNIVNQLRADDRVEVYSYVVNPPASAADIEAAAEAVGAAIPPALEQFYRAHDGVFLEWGLAGRSYKQTPAFGYPDYGQAPGCINIVPIAEAMSPDWASDYHVNEISEDHHTLLFGAPLDEPPKVAAVCIDNFSKYNHADLIFGPQPVMVVSTDHGADMDSSDFMSPALYLEMCLSLWGHSRYAHGAGIGWSRKSERLRVWTQQLTLDRAIALALTMEDQ